MSSSRKRVTRIKTEYTAWERDNDGDGTKGVTATSGEVMDEINSFEILGNPCTNIRGFWERFKL